MNRIFAFFVTSLTVSTSGMFLLAQPLSAQEMEGCFMIDSYGEVIKLPHLCPQPAQFPPIEASSATPQLTPEQAQQALSRASITYSDTYCEARARGGTNREATDSAISAMTTVVMNEGLNTDQITPDFFVTAEETSRSLCPELMPTGRYD